MQENYINDFAILIAFVYLSKFSPKSSLETLVHVHFPLARKRTKQQLSKHDNDML